ncbi:amidohydrolase family protein [Myxococcota bacterium]|nr:amidohydrolase family protein [Myxococcota bacterium]
MPRYADLILLPRGVINPGGPSGEGLAVAVAEGRIMAFGDAAALAPLRGPGAEVIRSAAWLLPAFRDAHLHLCGLGEALSTLQLQGLNLDALLHAVATAPGEGWLWGRGWDETRWPTRFLPALSAAAPKRPVALTRIDGHALWINRALLDILGLNAATPDPPGGWLSRDALGQPTGLLVDNAMALVPRPAPSAEALGGFIQRATDHLLSLGVVAACDMGASPPELEAILRAAPPLRLEVYLDAARGIEIRAPLRQGDVWARGVKLFADGALGSRGAWLRAPRMPASPSSSRCGRT